MATEPLESTSWRALGDDHPVSSPAVEKEGDLRPKNQITIPKGVADAMGLRPGDRLVFIVEERGSGRAEIVRIPRSFAGIAAGAYGGVDGTKRYLDGEREDWND